MVRQNIAPTKPMATAPPKPSGDNILQSIIGHLKALKEEMKSREQDIQFINERLSIMDGNIQKLAESVNAQRYYIEQMHRYHLSLKQIAASLDAMSTEYLNLTMPAQQSPEEFQEGYPAGESAEEPPEEPTGEPMSLDDLEAQVSGSQESEPEEPEEPVRPMPQRTAPVAKVPAEPIEPIPEPKPKKEPKEPKIKTKSAADLIRSLEASIDKE